MDGNAPWTRTSFVGAIRGPIVLIVLGVLFAVDYSLGISVGKTWPILLITVGLLHLLDRAVNRTDAASVPGHAASGEAAVIRPDDGRPGGGHVGAGHAGDPQP
jgi:hypothetical protein